MSDQAGELIVSVNGKDVGLATLLNRLEQLGKQADATLTASGARIGQAIGGGAGQAAGGLRALSAEEQRTALGMIELVRAESQAATEAQRLATEFQRTATAGNQAAAAAARVATESQREAAATANAAAANDRAAVAALRRAQAEARAADSSSRAASFAGQVGEAFGGQLASAVGPAAVAAVGFAAVQSGAELAQMGANAELTRQRFDGLAASAGTSGAALLASLRAASGGEINDLNLQLAANRAQLLGVASSAEEMGVLMGIARDRAQSLGTSAGAAFNDLITGLGRASPEILDNLAIQVSAEEANQRYAASIGKTVAELTQAERRQALVNAVIAQGREALNTTGGAAESNAGKLAKFGATVENIKTQAGGALAGAVTPALDLVSSLANAFDGSRESILAYVASSNAYMGATQAEAAANQQLATSFLDLIGVQSAASAANSQVSASDQAFAATRQALTAALAQGALSSAEYSAAIIQTEQAQQRANNAASIGTGAYDAYSAATLAAEQATRDFAVGVDEAGVAELTASVNAETLSDAKARLAEQAQSAAQAIIDGGGNIQATAARLAASSSQVDVLTAAYLRLLAAQQSAGIAGAQRLANQAKQTRNVAINPAELLGGPARRGTSDVDAVIRAQKEQKAETEAAAKATREQGFALANQAGQARILAGELEKLTPGTAAYITKQTDLLKLERDIASGRGGRGGGGGGGKTPKLTEAEREQQQLLKGQEDYANKSLDAEREYQDNLADIAEEGARKRLEAQNKYDLDRKRSAVSFYQSLAGFENQDLARDLSSRYEAAVGQAQEIARTKGADAGQAYLQAQREAIQSQGDLQNEIAKADKDGDKGKAEYYKGLLKMQQDADAEELRQIEAQGSQIAASENAQYATAEQRYAEHLEKMGIAYERKFGNAPPGLAPPPPASSGAGSSAGAAGAAAPGAAGATTGAAGVQLVADPGTQEALDGGLGRVEGVLNDIKSGIAAVEQRVGDVERAVGNIKINSALG